VATTSVRIIPAGEDRRPTLEHLVQLYLHDLSGVGGWDLRDDGTYGTDLLDGCWSGASRRPFLLRVADSLAGFAVVDRGSHVSDRSDVWDMAEFFVVNRWRQAGVGRSAARQLFAEFPGDWEVRPFPGYAPAERFWASVCTEAASSGVVTEADRRRSRSDGQILCFSAG
jgi:predicted acetyltransferase